MTRHARVASRTVCALGLSLVATVVVAGVTAAPGVGATTGERDAPRSAECDTGIVRANIRSAWTHVSDTRVTEVRTVDVGKQFAGSAEVLIFGEATATVWVRADACPGGESSSGTARRTATWVAIQEGTAQRVEADSRLRARKQAIEAASGQARRELRAIAIRRATQAALSAAMDESRTLAG